MSRTSGITGSRNNYIIPFGNKLIFIKNNGFQNIFGMRCDIHQIRCDIRFSFDCDIQKEESVWKSVWQQKNI